MLLKSSITYQNGDKVLREAVLMCTIFKYTSSDGSISRYFYGGGIIDEKSQNIILWYDLLRNSKFVRISTENIQYIWFNKTTLDVLFKDGSWVTGIVTSKISSAKCNIAEMKFNDPAILDIRGNIAVVNLPMLKMSAKDKYDLNKHNFMDERILSYNSPLTLAYKKDFDGIYIGYWSTEDNCFVSNIHKYWRILLDIGL